MALRKRKIMKTKAILGILKRKKVTTAAFYDEKNIGLKNKRKGLGR